jgi:hypothetical protein
MLDVLVVPLVPVVLITITLALAYLEARLPPRRVVDDSSIVARLRPQRDEAIGAGR